MIWDVELKSDLSSTNVCNIFPLINSFELSYKRLKADNEETLPSSTNKDIRRTKVVKKDIIAKRCKSL